jgi:uncharacterized protein involved in exopolysaccharide biosynthesis/Mrp family chromosome partitioning ATPase
MAIASVFRDPDPPAKRGGATIELSGDWPGERQETSVRDVLRVIFRRRGLAIAVFLATVIATCLWMWIGGDSYETSARVMIRFARDDADPKTSLSAANTRLIPANRPDINTEAELIKSYALVDRVVTTLHLDVPPVEIPPTSVIPRIKFELRRAYHSVRDFTEQVEIATGLSEHLSNREKAIVAVMRGLKVESVKESSVVKVSLNSQMKTGAGQVLNTLLDFYREQRLSAEKNPREAEFFASQAAQYEQSLKDKEQRLYELKKKYDISSFPDQIRLTMDDKSAAERAASASASKLAAAEAKADALKQQIAAEAPSKVVSEIASRNSALDFLTQKRASMELEKQKLVSKYKADDPFVQDADDELKRIKQLIDGTPPAVEQSRTTAPNATYESLQKEFLTVTQERAALDAEVRSETAAVARYTTDLHLLRDSEVAYKQLSREVSLDEDTYRLQEKNAQEAQSAEALNSKGITSIEVVDPAEDPILPSGIRKTYLFGGSLGLGLILAFGLVFITDAIDHSVGSPEEVERHLGHPVFGWLAHRKVGRDLSPPSGAALQQFLAIASRLDMAAGGSRKTITFVAASPHAGASTVAAGVAWALSKGLGKKVLLLAPNGSGAATSKLITGKESEQRRAGFVKLEWPQTILEINPNLGFSSAPFHVGDVTEKLVSERIQVLSGAMADYEYIMIDVGASAAHHERIGASRGSSGVVVVVQSDRTRREVLERMDEEFSREGINVLGAVLNQRRFPIPERIYNVI